jgi:cytochrome c oxidase cbb3-type subunit II
MAKDPHKHPAEGALPEIKADPVALGTLSGHAKLERNVSLLMAGTLVVVLIGGVVEIVPLFYVKNTIEKVTGMRPYSPLELAGRNIYIREGCYVCHSQMIRPFRDEVERYGHYSLAAESMYDHPFQWGSKRTGPDLARVGGRYSDDWHVAHLKDPQSVVPDSIMPSYAFLASAKLDTSMIKAHLKANTMVGVPYTDEMLENAEADMVAQANPDSDGAEAVKERYPKAVVSNFDGDVSKLTEMDAMVAYLQMLGTLVDFSAYDADAQANQR